MVETAPTLPDPTAEGAAPVAPPVTPPAPKPLADFTTATNKATGERKIYYGGQWQPLQKSATGPGGRKMYQFNNKWMYGPLPAPPGAPRDPTKGLAMRADLASQERVAQQLYKEHGWADWAPFNPKLREAIGYKGGRGPDMPWEKAKELIRKYESSGGQNIMNQPFMRGDPSSTASGPFQITDSRWKEYTAKLGMALGGGPLAKPAPAPPALSPEAKDLVDRGHGLKEQIIGFLADPMNVRGGYESMRAMQKQGYLLGPESVNKAANDHMQGLAEAILEMEDAYKKGGLFAGVITDPETGKRKTWQQWVGIDPKAKYYGLWHGFDKDGPTDRTLKASHFFGDLVGIPFTPFEAQAGGIVKWGQDVNHHVMDKMTEAAPEYLKPALRYATGLFDNAISAGVTVGSFAEIPGTKVPTDPLRAHEYAGRYGGERVTDPQMVSAARRAFQEQLQNTALNEANTAVRDAEAAHAPAAEEIAGADITTPVGAARPEYPAEGLAPQALAPQLARGPDYEAGWTSPHTGMEYRVSRDAEGINTIWFSHKGLDYEDVAHTSTDPHRFISTIERNRWERGVRPDRAPTTPTHAGIQDGDLWQVTHDGEPRQVEAQVYDDGRVGLIFMDAGPAGSIAADSAAMAAKTPEEFFSSMGLTNPEKIRGRAQRRPKVVTAGPAGEVTTRRQSVMGRQLEDLQRARINLAREGGDTRGLDTWIRGLQGLMRIARQRGEGTLARGAMKDIPIVGLGDAAAIAAAEAKLRGRGFSVGTIADAFEKAAKERRDQNLDDSALKARIAELETEAEAIPAPPEEPEPVAPVKKPKLTKREQRALEAVRRITRPKPKVVVTEAPKPAEAGAPELSAEDQQRVAAMQAARRAHARRPWLKKVFKPAFPSKRPERPPRTHPPPYGKAVKHPMTEWARQYLQAMEPKPETAIGPPRPSPPSAEMHRAVLAAQPAKLTRRQKLPGEPPLVLPKRPAHLKAPEKPAFTVHAQAEVANAMHEIQAAAEAEVAPEAAPPAGPTTPAAPTTPTTPTTPAAPGGAAPPAAPPRGGRGGGRRRRGAPTPPGGATPPPGGAVAPRSSRGRRALDLLSKAITKLLEAIEPEAISARAKRTGPIIAQRVWERVQSESRLERNRGFREAYEHWSYNPAGFAEFLSKVGRAGVQWSAPAMERAVNRLLLWNEQLYLRDTQVTGLKTDNFDRLIEQVFEDPERARSYLEGKYGDALKNPEWVRDNFWQAIGDATHPAGGNIPLTVNNPEMIMAFRQRLSDRSFEDEFILRDMADNGLAILKPRGRAGRAVRRPVNSRLEVSPSGRRYYVHHDAWVFINNVYKEKSLYNLGSENVKPIISMGLRGALAVKNAIVPIELSFSAFHPLHVIHIDQAASIARALHPGPNLLGHFREFLQGVSFVNTFIVHPYIGRKIQLAYEGRLPQDKWPPWLKTSMELAHRGGTSMGLDKIYKIQAERTFDQIYRELLHVKQNPWALLSGGYHVPFAILAMMRKPIFDYWIPWIKYANYTKDAKAFLAMRSDLDLNSNDPRMRSEIDQHLRRISRSIDNRFGEMSYDTLFWTRWLKDLAVLNTLSLGWTLGFIREYGGALKDVTQMTGAFRRGRGPLTIREGALYRPLFIATYNTTALAYNGLLTYFFTGKKVNPFTGEEDPSQARKDFYTEEVLKYNAPQRLMDMTYPRSGEQNADGSPVRLKTPFFWTTEIAPFYIRARNLGFMRAIGDAAASKEFGMFGLAAELTGGLLGTLPIDSLHRDYLDPDGDFMYRLSATLGQAFYEVEPMSLRSLQDRYPIRGEPIKEQIAIAREHPLGVKQAIAGLTKAPLYATESRTENIIADYFRRHYTPEETPFWKTSKAEDFKKLRQLRDAVEIAEKGGDTAQVEKANERFYAAMDRISEKEKWSAKTRESIRHSLRSKYTVYEHMFKAMNQQDQRALIKRADPEDQERLRHIMSREARRQENIEEGEREDAKRRAEAEAEEKLRSEQGESPPAGE